MAAAQHASSWRGRRHRQLRSSSAEPGNGQRGRCDQHRHVTHPRIVPVGLGVAPSSARLLTINEERWRWLLDDRAPPIVFELAANRRRRPLLGEDGRLVIIAADHPARRILGVGDDRWAMADRRGCSSA